MAVAPFSRAVFTRERWLRVGEAMVRDAAPAIATQRAAEGETAQRASSG